MNFLDSPLESSLFLFHSRPKLPFFLNPPLVSFPKHGGGGSKKFLWSLFLTFFFQIRTGMRQHLSWLSLELLNVSPLICFRTCKQQLDLRCKHSRHFAMQGEVVEWSNSADIERWWERKFGHRQFRHVCCRCNQSESVWTSTPVVSWDCIAFLVLQHRVFQSRV